MRIGNTTDAFLKYYGSADAAYARMKELGYDTADVGIFDVNDEIYADVTAMEKWCRTEREAAAKNGVEIFQVHGPWPTDDTTEESRARVWDCMHRAVYGCHLLGAKYLVIHPQMPYGWGREDDADYSEKLTVDLLRELIPDCEKYGVIVCLENMPMTAHRISPIKNIAETVEKIASPYIGICLDTGHSNVFADDLGDAVRTAAPWLKVLHIHDNNGKSDQHLLPWLGSCNWDSFTRALAEIGYEGSISLETNGPVSDTMPIEVRQAAEELTAEAAKSFAYAVDSYR